jgi:chromosome partitioning protein
VQIISVLAQKGGAGKTTLTLHWAVEVQAQTGAAVAVVDTDPQKTAVKWYERRAQETPEVMQAEPEQLPKALELCRSKAIEYLFVDTMPRVERWPSVEAARVADLVVIPCGPTVPDIESVADSVEIVKRTKTKAIMVLNNGVPGSSHNQKVIDLLEREFQLPICPIPIIRRTALFHAFNDGRAIGELAPGSKGALEIRKSWRWISSHLAAQAISKARKKRAS